jgi:hypothetical protein
MPTTIKFMNSTTKISTLLFASLFAGVAVAGEEPFGRGFAGWSFTQTDQPNGVILCRAKKRVAEQEFVIGYRTKSDNAGYFAVSAAPLGLKAGNYPKSVMQFGSKTIGGTMSSTQGIRVTFPLGDPDLEDLAREGPFLLRIGNVTTVEVDLGPRVADAYANVLKCVKANGG